MPHIAGASILGVYECARCYRRPTLSIFDKRDHLVQTLVHRPAPCLVDHRLLTKLGIATV
jgi:hypothetical protein